MGVVREIVKDRLLSQPNTYNRAQISVLLGCKCILPFVSWLRSRVINARGSRYTKYIAKYVTYLFSCIFTKLLSNLSVYSYMSIYGRISPRGRLFCHCDPRYIYDFMISDSGRLKYPVSFFFGLSFVCGVYVYVCV